MPVHQVMCPYCNFDVFFESSMDFIFMAQRECPGCDREFLIVDGVGAKDESLN